MSLNIGLLTATVEGRKILDGVAILVNQGEIHAVMGPNGSGKTTLARVILGDDKFQVQEPSRAVFEGQDLLTLTVDDRARAGIYVAWQNPMTIPGLNVFTLCKAIYEAKGNKIDSVLEFKKKIEKLLERVGLTKDYLGRGVNEGFSGGEKKRLELLQLLLIKPKLAVLDEVDSGLDVDALRLVGQVVGEMSKEGTAFILITHYKRLLEYVKPEFVHILKKGKIIRSGGEELVEEIEVSGYGK